MVEVIFHIPTLVITNILMAREDGGVEHLPTVITSLTGWRGKPVRATL